jgi:hypothetical protein
MFICICIYEYVIYINMVSMMSGAGGGMAPFPGIYMYMLTSYYLYLNQKKKIIFIHTKSHMYRIFESFLFSIFLFF